MEGVSCCFEVKVTRSKSSKSEVTICPISFELLNTFSPELAVRPTHRPGKVKVTARCQFSKKIIVYIIVLN